MIKTHNKTMTPREKLYNPYYFVKSNVVYNISYSVSDKNDSCAKHYVTYETESKELKKGDSYTDLHGDKQILSEDSTVNVSTGELNYTECKKNFPYISFTYTKEGDENTYETYVWLDNAIKVGDQISSNRFVKTVHGETESTVDFAEAYKEEVVNGIAKAVVGGKSIETAKKAYPSYIFANSQFVYNNKNVTRTSITSSARGNIFPITDESIQEAVINTINEQTVNYANKLLANIDMVVKEEASLVTSENTEGLE